MTGNVFDQAMAVAAGGGRPLVPAPMPEQDGGPSIFDQAMTAAAQVPPPAPEPAPPAQPPASPYDPENDAVAGLDSIAGLLKNFSLGGLKRSATSMQDAGTQLIGRGLHAIAPQGSAFEGAVNRELDRVNTRASEREKTYQEERAARGDTGFDTGRMVGDIALTLPFGAGVAGSLPARIAGNAMAGGAAAALTQPVNEGDFWQEKAKQAGLGAAGAVAAMPITGALSRLVSPNASTNPNVQTLINEGVRLTPGQMGGGVIKRAEDAATSTPLLGDAIRSSQRQGVEDLNRAALNRALAPIGKELPSDMKVGREAVDYVKTEISREYDNLLPRLQATPDMQFIQDTTQIINKLRAVDPNIADQFSNTFQKYVVDRFAPNNQIQAMSGDMLKTLETDLGKIASTYLPKGGGEGMYGQAIADTQAALRDLITRNNPQYGPELAKVNEAFKNRVVIDRAAGAQGSVEGVFSPNQLSAAVKSSDRSVRSNRFAAGQATMQDLSDPAKAIMPSSIPDSGTAARLFFNSGSLGQLALLPMALGAGAYTNLGRGAAEYLLARRPGMAQPLAQGLLSASPALGAAAAPSIYGLLQ